MSWVDLRDWRERLPHPDAIWYQGHWLGPALAPLGWLYCGIANGRRLAYRRGWLPSYGPGVPVIVVGNLTVGGTGKTPLVLWLAGHLAARELKVGIALRGYGGATRSEPRLVSACAAPEAVGDEALLLAQRAPCPVVVGRDRVAAARLLAETYGCTLVLTDDGLQHYRLQRQLELLVIDGERELGNRRCLPAGPLREPPSRELSADLVIRNGGPSRVQSYRMELKGGALVNLRESGQQQPVTAFRGQRVTAIAGIGHPDRFFRMLRQLGLLLDARAYPDHHLFTADEVASWPAGPVVMTEKDAVKCRTLARQTPATKDHWYLPVTAAPEPAFLDALDRALERRLGIQAPTTDAQRGRHTRDAQSGRAADPARADR